MWLFCSVQGLPSPSVGPQWPQRPYTTYQTITRDPPSTIPTQTPYSSMPEMFTSHLLHLTYVLVQMSPPQWGFTDHTEIEFLPMPILPTSLPFLFFFSWRDSHICLIRSPSGNSVTRHLGQGPEGPVLEASPVWCLMLKAACHYRAHTFLLHLPYPMHKRLTTGPCRCCFMLGKIWSEQTAQTFCASFLSDAT